MAGKFPFLISLVLILAIPFAGSAHDDTPRAAFSAIKQAVNDSQWDSVLAHMTPEEPRLDLRVGRLVDGWGIDGGGRFRAATGDEHGGDYDEQTVHATCSEDVLTRHRLDPTGLLPTP